VAVVPVAPVVVVGAVVRVGAGDGSIVKVPITVLPSCAYSGIETGVALEPV
jgi:hypothetical protein